MATDRMAAWTVTHRWAGSGQQPRDAEQLAVLNGTPLAGAGVLSQPSEAARGHRDVQRSCDVIARLGLFDSELSGRVGLEPLIGDGRSAADRTPECAGIQTSLGTVQGGQPLTQAGRKSVVELLVCQRCAASASLRSRALRSGRAPATIGCRRGGAPPRPFRPRAGPAPVPRPSRPPYVCVRQVADPEQFLHAQPLVVRSVRAGRAPRGHRIHYPLPIAESVVGLGRRSDPASLRRRRIG